MEDRHERDEDDLGESVRPGAQARHAFLLIKDALSGDLPPAVVGAHERQQDHLEHHQPGGEPGQLGVGHLHLERLLHFGHRRGIAVHRDLQDIPSPLEVEDDHEQREAEGDRQREPEVTGIAEEELEAPGKQRRELRDATRDVRLGKRLDLGRRADLGDGDLVGILMLGLMDSPAVAPRGEVGGVQHLVQTQSVGDAEIAEQFIGGTLENHVALIDDRDPVELVQLTEIMDDADEALVARLGKIAKQRQDLVLGLRVESRRDFVADHAGRIERELQAEGKTAQLAARKRRDAFVAMRGHARDAQDGFKAARTLGGVRHGELEGVLQRFGDGQLRLSGGELRSEADLADQVFGAGDPLAGQTGFAGRRQDAQDGLHQGRLAATRRPDDGVEAARQEAGVGAVEDDGAVITRLHGEILAAQHRL